MHYSLRNPRADPRRCSSRPLMALVGSLNVPGRSVGENVRGSRLKGPTEAS